MRILKIVVLGLLIPVIAQAKMCNIEQDVNTMVLDLNKTITVGLQCHESLLNIGAYTFNETFETCEQYRAIRNITVKHLQDIDYANTSECRDYALSWRSNNKLKAAILLVMINRFEEIDKNITDMLEM